MITVIKQKISWIPFAAAILDRLNTFHRKKIKRSIDIILITFAYPLAHWVRFEGHIPAEMHGVMLRSLPILILSSLLSFYLFKLYNYVWRYTSFKDFVAIFVAHTVGLVGFYGAINILQINIIPRSVLLIYWMCGLLFFCWSRLFFGFLVFEYLVEIFGHTDHHKKIRTLIVGAGSAGEIIVRQMTGSREKNYDPIGIVDDDTRKHNSRIHGIPVIGDIDDIPKLAREKRAELIVIAIPSAFKQQQRRIFERCQKSGIKFKTIPSLHEIINGPVELSQLRDVNLNDLINRNPFQTDNESVSELISGKVVLVTGACGSIGKEVCHQIMQFNPKNVLMLDRNENDLFYLENEMRSNYGSGYKTILCDICDSVKLNYLFKHFKPFLVYHAAAYKHVPVMEQHPEEAIKNNLGGTMLMANLAMKYNVSHFVLISTDKAVEPTNMMGLSKRLAELFIRSLHKSTTKFMTVRFGNVLGSNGSVVPIFQKQIAQGGPITVTDENMTRFFMTISEAVELILQASTIGNGGETFILDMGEPIKVVDLAQHLIKMSGLEPERDIKIEFIGRRPGEKMSEKLWYDEEKPEQTVYEKILASRTNGYHNQDVMKQLQKILDFAQNMQQSAMFSGVQELFPSFPHPKKEVFL